MWKVLAGVSTYVQRGDEKCKQCEVRCLKSKRKQPLKSRPMMAENQNNQMKMMKRERFGTHRTQIDEENEPRGDDCKRSSKLSVVPKRRVVPTTFVVKIPKALKRNSIDLAILKVNAHDICMTELPPGVIAIDYIDHDKMTSSLYTATIVKYAKTQEKHLLFSSKFPDCCPNKGIHRAVLVDWLIIIQDYLRLNQETLHLAVQMLDRFLMVDSLELTELQLLGITCLLLASKYNETMTPSIQDLISLTDDTYTFDDVIQMEMRILNTLKFKLHIPTPIPFLDRGLEVIGKNTNVGDLFDPFLAVGVLSRQILNLTLPCVHVVHCPPSVKAAAAIYLAQQTLNEVADLSSESCIRSLAYHLHCERDEVIGCVLNFAKLLKNVNPGSVEVPMTTDCHKDS
ncbi:hypothetical protein LSH36_20g04020 [Paralvinella palmiformis]|uniref:Uncharacterized protein n=1 Tax=Paralvinella palmiformis TaxID=53620 RepID=A0AAD9KB46_9ANNE|nr:hypothetical protein LSH36_20g04020 [Paralvinella palmiformis]